MFTGIVQGTARVDAIEDRAGLRTLRLAFAPGFDAQLQIGASVAVSGVCLTVTALHDRAADFDVMQQTLAVTTLGALQRGVVVNVERAAKEGAEVGGHVLSGHIDTQARVLAVRTPDNNRVLRLGLPSPWMRYVFAKGYIALDGASLTVAEAGRERDGSGWFEVWLIPETLRITTFAALREGDAVNVEIERQTQVIVDTVRAAVDERLGPLLPALEAFARERGLKRD
jgi:riboflavin synthase